MSLVTIKKSNATINVGSNADYAIFGDDDLVLVGSSSTVSATGLALTVQVAGPGDAVTIGGDGVGAPDGSDDVVLFEAGGTLDVLANSRVDSNGTKVTANLAGDDTFGLYGASDTVNANGLHDALYIGQNGTAGSVDSVIGLILGSLFELQGSNVAVGGKRNSITMTGADVLTVSGESMAVSASGAGNVVHIQGGQAGDGDSVTFADGGLVIASDVQFLQVFGAHVTLRGLANVYQTELIGSADRAVISGLYDNFTIGGNGRAGALDVVVADYFPALPLIEATSNANVKVIADGAKIFADGDDRILVIGHDDTLTDAVGGNLFALDGLNNVGEGNLGDVAQHHTGDVMRLRANTRLGVSVSGNAGPGAVHVVLAANDVVSGGPDVTFVAPVALGRASLQFSAGDRLLLSTAFADVADLLAHTTDGGMGAVIRLDTHGDQLTLLGVSKAQVGADADAGIIKFA